MTLDSFTEYSTKNVHFLDENEQVSSLLEYSMRLANYYTKRPIILDLGCGDGKLIFVLYKRGLLRDAGKVIGVDISQDRITRMAKALPFVKGIASDALQVKSLPNSAADFVICSQVIEHVDDKKLLVEIDRLLADRGIAYISSVVKKWYGVYFYFRSGHFRLDPTHVREYSSLNEFVSLIPKESFDVIAVYNKSQSFPIIDLIIRFLIKFEFVEPDANFYHYHTFLGKLRKLRLRIFGYQTCEVLVRKYRKGFPSINLPP
jgi:SAM-dependent methyltransferase